MREPHSVARLPRGHSGGASTTLRKGQHSWLVTKLLISRAELELRRLPTAWRLVGHAGSPSTLE
jgi:hypothetical protein